MNNLGHAQEVLTKTVRALASGTDGIYEQLRGGYSSNFAHLQEAELKLAGEEACSLFREIKERTTRDQAKVQSVGKIHASTQMRSLREIDEIIEKIYYLKSLVNRAYYGTHV